VLDWNFSPASKKRLKMWPLPVIQNERFPNEPSTSAWTSSERTPKNRMGEVNLQEPRTGRTQAEGGKRDQINIEKWSG